MDELWKRDGLKCAHCGCSIGSYFYKIHRDEDGRQYNYHDDPVMGKKCLDNAGVSRSLVQYPNS